jgi:hypothetical protein
MRGERESDLQVKGFVAAVQASRMVELLAAIFL